MIEYRFLPPAELEMIEAALFYENASPGLGSKFISYVNHSITNVRRHPRMGEVLSGVFRRVVLRAFPFSLIYVIQDRCVLIIAIAHLLRAPYYWNSRLR